MYPDYRFENDQWFNIPEENRLQLTQTQRYYQSQKRQRTDASIRTNSQYQHKRQVQQIYLYYQPVPETIFQLPPQSHGSVPPPPHPRQSEIPQINQQPHADDFSAMTQSTIGASIMGGQNEQAYLKSKNTNGSNIPNVSTHRRVGRENSLTEPDPNTTGYYEADTNANIVCLG